MVQKDLLRVAKTTMYNVGYLHTTTLPKVFSFKFFFDMQYLIEMFEDLIDEFDSDTFDSNLINVLIGLLALCNDPKLKA